MLPSPGQQTYDLVFDIQSIDGWTMPSLGRINRERGGRWFIQLPGRVRSFCDRNHQSFYGRQHAEYTLHRIHSEVESGTFDETCYAKSKRSLSSFPVYADEWLVTCERRMKGGDLSPSLLERSPPFCPKAFCSPLWQCQHR